MKTLAVAFGVIVIAITAVVLVAALTGWRPLKGADTGILALGSFVILALTLVVLVVYAYDTNSIADLARQRWLREGVLGTTYNIQLIGTKGDAGRTLVQLANSSALVVRAKVSLNARVYGDAVSAGPLYDGQEVWLLFPQQSIQGWFEVESLLQMKGKTAASMIAERTSANHAKQLTMMLELEFWDELGVRRKLPPRHHYFDFDRWLWIPHIAEQPRLP